VSVCHDLYLLKSFGLTSIREFIRPVFSRLLWGFVPGERFADSPIGNRRASFLFA
jgi:hypothetical protein